MLNYQKKVTPGLFLCLLITVPSYFLGKLLPVIGGAVFAIIFGLIIAIFLSRFNVFDAGIKVSSKHVLQLAIIILGFKLNLRNIFSSGKEALPIIISTIFISLISAYIFAKVFNINRKIATLIGVGSSICGGSAVAATAPVIKANEGEIANSISVIFLFNILAAFIFPYLGQLLNLTDHGFAIFAGTAINDTSSVVAAAASWEGIHKTTGVVDAAAIVKLTRTLAILPIVLSLALYELRKVKKESEKSLNISFTKIFPWFILFFLLASVLTTFFKLDTYSNVKSTFSLLSELFIIFAMSGIGLKTNIVHLFKSGLKSILLGFICWVLIIITSLTLQYLLNLW